MAGHLRVPTAPFSHCHLPQQCFRLDLVRASPVDRLAFYFPILALFPIVFYFCLFSLLFGFDFSQYCSFSVCFVYVLFLQFCRSPSRQFRRPPPTVGLYAAPPHNELQMHLSMVGVCLNTISFSLYFLFCLYLFFSLYLCCVFACNNALVSLVWLDPLWS